MSGRTFFQRDQIRRRSYEKKELHHTALKALANNQLLTPQFREHAKGLLHTMVPPILSKTRMHNMCPVTFRPRGFNRFWKMGRNQFRELALNGILPGVRKSSW